MNESIRNDQLQRILEAVVIPFFNKNSKEEELINLLKNDKSMKSRARKELAGLVSAGFGQSV